MKKLAFVIIMGLVGAPLSARADLTHKMTSSVQLNVNAAATQVNRIGTTYSISGNNVGTTHGTGSDAITNGIGALTISSGVGAVPAITATQAVAGESFSLSQSFTQGDALASSVTTGAVSPYGNQVSTAAGVAGTLAGTIDSSSTMTLTGGGAGTQATGQFTVELSINH